MIGKTISHYTITEKLGSGGMGIVYKAQDLKLDRFVALKFLPPHLTTSEDEKQRFIHEAKAASSLDHNNICNIYEIDETEDGQLFISMAYYEGETLDKKIEEKPLPINKAIDITIQIAQGLAKAHDKEIVHRDIKPANIMLTADGVVKILDFGLAKLSTQTKLTKESTTLGTVSYMSPEQAKGDKVDHRTDIWSLGVIIYEMLTGQLPFKGDYESAVIYSIVNETQEPVTALRTGVPMELEQMINKCLQKSPADRYQHVDELIVDLRSMKRESESTGIPTVKEPPKKRSKYVIMSAAVISIVILIVAGYFILIQPGEKSASGWENSIAVLPFADLSPEKDQEYFCDGMTEQIITNLTKLNKLKVTARTSVNKFRDTDKTAPEIGRELQVENILEGSIFKSGNSVRITAQLINARDGSHIWAEIYDRDLKNLFVILDDVSKSIAGVLLEKLSLNEVEEIQTQRPSNIDAYEYYLKGNYFHDIFFWGQLKNEDFNTSEMMYKKSITLDSSFALSYAGLADLYNTYWNYLAQFEEEKQKYLELQEKYISIAFRLDSTSADVNLVKYWIHFAKFETENSYECIKRALNLNANHGEYNRAFGRFLFNIGLAKQSINYYNKTIELDPLSTIAYISRGQAYFQIEKFTEAETNYQKALEIDAKSYLALGNYAELLIALNNYEKAEELLMRIDDETVPVCRYWIALLHAAKGEKEKALKILNDLDIWTYKIPSIYILLGMNEEVFKTLNEGLEQAYERDSSWYLHLKNHPQYINLRSDPRFQEILAKHKELYEENLAKYGDIEELIN